MKTGIVPPARLITPRYPLLFRLLLAEPVQCRHPITAGGGFHYRRARAGPRGFDAYSAAPVVVTETVMSRLVATHPSQPQLLRAQKVYEVYGDARIRWLEFAEWFPQGLANRSAPLGTAVILDISLLWKPYGSRRVEPCIGGFSRTNSRARRGICRRRRIQPGFVSHHD